MGSIALEDRSIIVKVKALLGFRAKGRKIKEVGKGYYLREGPAHYNSLFEAKRGYRP